MTPAADAVVTQRVKSALGIDARFAGVSSVLGKIAFDAHAMLEDFGGGRLGERNGRALARGVRRGSLAAVHGYSPRCASRRRRWRRAFALTMPGRSACRAKYTVSTFDSIMAR